MVAWLSANLINIVLVALIVLIVAFLIRGMIRDRRAGKSSCGGSCASCGACGGCSSCSQCGAVNGRMNGTSSGSSR